MFFVVPILGLSALALADSPSGNIAIKGPAPGFYANASSSSTEQLPVLPPSASVTDAVTVVTTTQDGVETIYTTYCPETKDSTSSVVTSSQESSKAALYALQAENTVFTTRDVLVTVTSCDDNKCSETVSTSTVTLVVTVAAAATKSAVSVAANSTAPFEVPYAGGSNKIAAPAFVLGAAAMLLL